MNIDRLSRVQGKQMGCNEASPRLLSEIRAAEEATSLDADVWDKHFLLSLTVANGFGVTSQIGLLQAANDVSLAAIRLFGPALVFIAGIALSAFAVFVAARSASLLSKALFEQGQALMMDDPYRGLVLTSVMKRTDRSRRLDHVRWFVSGGSAICFVTALVWTFAAVRCGALG